MQTHQRMNSAERGTLLRAYPILRLLPPALFQKLEDCVERLDAPAGFRLFNRGDQCTHHPLLVKGRVRVAMCDSEGNEILLYRLVPGETCVITAVTLLGESRYPASGTVEANISGYAVPRHFFQELVVEAATFRVFVFNAISDRMATIMAFLENLAFRGIAQRLAKRLLEHELPIATTHQTLADELGTRREVVSRILGTFQQSGAIKLARKRIEILDRHALNILSSSGGA